MRDKEVPFQNPRNGSRKYIKEKRWSFLKFLENRKKTRRTVQIIRRDDHLLLVRPENLLLGR